MKLTAKDIIGYLAVVNVNFENAYKQGNNRDYQILIDTWLRCLSEYPKEICDEAFFRVIKRAKFAPKIGDVTEEIEKMQLALRKDASQLWAELSAVLKEVRDCVYMFQFTGCIDDSGISQGKQARIRVDEIYKTLDPTLKDYCGSKSGLLELANLDSDQLTFEKARFIKAIPRLMESAEVRKQLPEKVQQLLSGISKKTMIDTVKLLEGEELCKNL